MDMQDLPLLTALKKRMGWLTKNQRVISENLANADTPGFRANRLEAQQFSTLLSDVHANRVGGNQLSGAERAERAARGGLTNRPKDEAQTREDKEAVISPTGNSVVLEEEMLKLADTQLEYGLVVELYKKNAGLMRIALGRRGI